ncbi:subtilase family protein [mine drainage metagenome]|uniref:Subtilase family protein n=1 Tax=mine drainage metagenome TaxID=410659 RepID=A0A1J5R4Q9_9ZZZZ
MAGENERNLPHVFVRDRVEGIEFTNPTASGPRGRSFPDRDRAAHAAKLLRQLDALRQADASERASRAARGLPTEYGIVVEFAAGSEFRLKAQSLERRDDGISLLNIRKISVSQPDGRTSPEEFATVRIPAGKLEVFETLVSQYRDQTTRPGSETPKNQPLVASIGEIRRAAFEAFWTAPTEIPATGIDLPWEAWLRAGESQGERAEILERFRTAAAVAGVRLIGRALNLPEATIHLIQARREQLQNSIELLDCLCELRAPAVGAAEFDEMAPEEQRALVEAIAAQLVLPSVDAPAVCLLDTGLNHGHPLLAPVVAPNGLHSYLPAWGTDDRHQYGVGHGTQMGGLAAFGDLTEPFQSSLPVVATHWLESAKILNDADPRPRDEWGNIVRDSIAAVEQSAPQRKRVFAQQITAENTCFDGRPTSWSAATDQLCTAYGEDPMVPRLIFVSAGNYHCANSNEYPAKNRDWSVHDPAQAWNVITVGACTAKDAIRDPRFSQKPVIAPSGGFAPMSSTSCMWDKEWPIKPDIVFEGGNRFIETDHTLWDHADLKVLTTHAAFADRLLTTADGTSASSAQAARLAAIIQKEYPNAWPETIRALLIHSAEWTQGMVNGRPLQTKVSVIDLMRHCGHGQPNLLRALRTARSSVTLVVEDEFQPFKKDGSSYKTNEMRFHDLPWPKDALESLGAAQVQMRVTLSYFVEPNPGTRLTTERYRYGSCHLRFEVQRPLESEHSFRERINGADRPEGYRSSGSSDSDAWTIGSDARHRGSLHQDTWKGTAAELGSKPRIAVYPVTGWWRLRPHLGRYEDKVRYSLVVSLRAPGQGIDLYTPIVQQMTVPLPVAVPGT